MTRCVRPIRLALMLACGLGAQACLARDAHPFAAYAGLAGATLEDAGTLVVRGGGPFDRSEVFEVLRRADGGYTLLNTITAASGAYRVQARFDHDSRWNSQRAEGVGLYKGIPVSIEMRRESGRVAIRVAPLSGQSGSPFEGMSVCEPDCFINMSPSATAMFVMTRHYDFARGGEQEFRWAGQDLDRERTLSGGLAKLRFNGEVTLARTAGPPVVLRHFSFVESLPLPDGNRFLLDFDLWTDREHRPMAFRIRTTGGSASGVLGVRESVEGLREALTAPSNRIPPPAYVDPASVVPGSKAVARRVTLVVADLERTRRFYEALGFREDRRVDVTDAASLNVFGLPPDAKLTFIRMTGDNTLSTGRIDGGTLGFAQVRDRRLRALRERTRGETMLGTPILVMTTDGVDAVHERLRAIGAEILAPPESSAGGLRSMLVRDPDGTRMEITQPP